MNFELSFEQSFCRYNVLYMSGTYFSVKLIREKGSLRYQVAISNRDLQFGVQDKPPTKNLMYFKFVDRITAGGLRY